MSQLHQITPDEFRLIADIQRRHVKRHNFHRTVKRNWLNWLAWGLITLGAVACIGFWAMVVIQ